MQPTCIQILQSIALNLEELILPALDQPHAKSAAVAARGLLEHVILRLESEGAALEEDNSEKRQLLTTICETIQNSSELSQISDLAELASRLSEGGKQTPASPKYVAIDALADENDTLKGLLEMAIVTLYQHHDEINASSLEALRQPIRQQLRAQLDREVAFVSHDYQGWVF